MVIIFGTTNERKIADLKKLIEYLKLSIEVKSLNDIGWDRNDIEENGKTLEENSLIKATEVYKFCKDKNINEFILTDDAGLFVESLNGEPGIYTGRYASLECEKDKTLPKYECVNKLLRKLEGVENRRAYYRCVVTFMDFNGNYFQEEGISYGNIALEAVKPIEKPYFYSVFKLENSNKTFNMLNLDELYDSYRYVALRKVLLKVGEKND